MKSLKQFFIAQIVEEAIKVSDASTPIKVLDLGCGTANYVADLKKKFPNIEYVGVEPIKASYDIALENVSNIQGAEIHFQLGYDQISGLDEKSFDLVFSMSVLEHVKDLNRFIALSAKYLKSGGLMVHRYDLGHALHTHSLKEKIHVFLGNNFPQILPERQFVRYVDSEEVKQLYVKNGVEPINVTYHQMPDHKRFASHLRDNVDLIQELFTLETKYQKEIKSIKKSARENLFPTISVWGKIS